jgi:hypothetical protein
MNVIADTWRGLVKRRLWPLAVLLVAALVAVPLALAKNPAPTATADAPIHAAAGDDDASSSFVTLNTPSEDGKVKRRRVLGMPKDPFAPAPPPKQKKHKKAKKAQATPTPAPEAPSGGSTAPPSSPPAGPTPTPVAGTVVAKGSIKIKFGKVDTSLDELTLAKLDPAPSDDDPVLVFEGLQNGGKTAVFSIAGLVAGQGDGTCDPDPANCATVKLHAGDTEFITVTDADDNSQVQYELDLVKIFTKKTVVADNGSASSGADN